MKSLAISNHGLRNSGGIERYALTLVRGLHARGLRPVFIAKSFDPSLPEVAWVDTVRVRLTGLPAKLRDLAFDWRIRRIKQRLGLFPLIACNQTGAADIAICGSTHPGYLAAMGLRAGLSDRWKIALEHAHLSNAQFVVAHSRRMADEAQHHHGVPVGKVHLLYPPVDGRRFCPTGSAERQRLREGFGLPQDRAVFLLVSTGHRRKGLDLLLEFFRSTPLPVSLAVAGRPIEASAPNIHYLGYRKDIENVYRAVDFTVVASVYEPFGLVGVESVLCGTPVLIAAGVGCAEVILPPAQLPFDGHAEGSLGVAVDEALARWKDGMARLSSPLQCLSYDPSVAVHVDALLALARACQPEGKPAR
jgi:glycosyltransferase involved in cell wall biosynthesis